QCSPSQLLPATTDQWINFTHRMAVGLSDVLMLVLAVAIWRTRRHDRRLMKSVHALAVLYVSQVFLGAFTIWLQAPAALRGAHLALAAATWAALVVLAGLVWADEGQGSRGQELGPGPGSEDQRVRGSGGIRTKRQCHPEQSEGS